MFGTGICRVDSATITASRYAALTAGSTSPGPSPAEMAAATNSLILAWTAGSPFRGLLGLYASSLNSMDTSHRPGASISLHSQLKRTT